MRAAARLPLLAGARVRLAGAVACLVAACGGERAESWRPFDLLTGLAESARLEVEPAAPELETVALALAERLDADGPFPARALAAGAPGDPARVRVLLGEVTDPRLAPALERLRVLGDAAGFTVGARNYTGANDLVCGVVPDPERPGLPLVVLAGNDADAVARLAPSVSIAHAPSVTVLRDGELERIGRLVGPPPAGIAWETDRTRALAAAAAGAEQVRGDLALRVGRAPASLARVDAYAERAGAAVARARAWLGSDAVDAPLPVELHGDTERMGERLGRVGAALVVPVTGRVHVALAPGVPDDGGAGAAAAELERAWGPPAAPWLAAGAGVLAAREWWGRDLDVWLATLALAELAPTGREVVAPRPGLGRHRLAPVAALMVGFALEREGPEGLRALWRGDETLAIDSALQLRLEDALAVRVESHGDAILEAREARRVAAFAASLDGVRLALPDAPGRAGGSTARQSLEELAEVGASAAFAPLERWRRPGAPVTPLGDAVVRDALRIGTAGDRRSDVELAALLAAADAQGLSGVLELRLREGPHTELSGQRILGNVADWEALFRDYRDLVADGALFAELTRCQALLLGSELVTATPSRAPAEASLPKNPAIAEQFRQLPRARGTGWIVLIGLAQRVFSGPVVYVAHPGGERQLATFWRQLDVAGLALHRALFGEVRGTIAPPARAVMEALRTELGVQGEFARQRGTRALVIAGFPATRDGWNTPWRRNGPTDPSAQAEYMLALALAAQQMRAAYPELAGVVVEQWSIDPADAAADARGFELRGRPAIESLARLLRRP